VLLLLKHSSASFDVFKHNCSIVSSCFCRWICVLIVIKCVHPQYGLIILCIITIGLRFKTTATLEFVWDIKYYYVAIIAGETMKCSTYIPDNGIVVVGNSRISGNCKLLYAGGLVPALTWSGPEPFNQTYSDNTTFVQSFFYWTQMKDHAADPILRFTALAHFEKPAGPVEANMAVNVPSYEIKYTSTEMIIYCRSLFNDFKS